MDKTQEILYLGHSNWTIELILFHKFSTFFTFILGSPIRYYPRGNVGKPGTFPCTYIQSEEKSMWPLKEDL